MKILICEDEAPAQKQLKRMILEIRSDAEIIGMVETGEEALSAIRHEHPDLIFMDIELADGPCFETLSNEEITVPTIFTTAYDEYALKAFSMNSIDYIVKPVSLNNVEKVFLRYDQLRKNFIDSGGFVFDPSIINGKQYKERFLVKLGRKLFSVRTDEIAYFIARDKLVWLVTREKKYVVNYTLSELDELLDPDHFFRLNRQIISNIDSVKNLEPYFKGQVSVTVDPPLSDDVIVSRTKTPELKQWLGV